MKFDQTKHRVRAVKKSKEEILNGTLSAVQVAALFGVSTRSVRGYAERGLLERTADGRYPLSGFGNYFENLRKQAADNAEINALTRSRTELTSVRAREIELRLDRLRAEYVDRETAAAGWRQVREIVDRNVLALTERIGAAVPRMTPHDLSKVAELSREFLQSVDVDAAALGIIGAEK